MRDVFFDDDYDAECDSHLMDSILMEESEKSRYIHIPEREQEREEDPEEHERPDSEYGFPEFRKQTVYRKPKRKKKRH